MADWVWVESAGTGVTERQRMRVAQFGDGYQQRAPDGINAGTQEWQYAADDVADEVAADMVAFLRANKGAAFNYWPMWATVAIKVTCDEWTRTLGSRPGASTIRATFKQVFEP